VKFVGFTSGRGAFATPFDFASDFVVVFLLEVTICVDDTIGADDDDCADERAAAAPCIRAKYSSEEAAMVERKKDFFRFF
jgi:hypothetical protein